MSIAQESHVPEENSTTPAGVGSLEMQTGGGDHFAVLPPANMLSSLRDVWICEGHFNWTTGL
jgi:hypothetical protein